MKIHQIHYNIADKASRDEFFSATAALAAICMLYYWHETLLSKLEKGQQSR